MSIPRVSVVILCYNAAGTIGRLLDQLELQSLPRERFEIIVVDDGSTDGTLEMLEKNDRVLLMPQERRGPGVGRNRGMAQAKGELILFLDADLEVAPDLLEQHVTFHARHPDVAATGGSVALREELPLFSWALADHLASWFNVHPGAEYDRRPEYLPSLNFCIKHAVIDTYRLTWADGLRHSGEDVSFCLAMRRQHLKLGFVPEAVVWPEVRTTLREHASQMYRRGFHMPFVRSGVPDMAYGFLYPRHPLFLPFTLPLIVAGHTLSIWKGWLGSRLLAATCALPQLLVGRLAYAWGVARGTLACRREPANH